MVLVAIPYREKTPWAFVAQTRRHFDALTYPDRRLVMLSNDIEPTGRKYEPNAIARNQLIDEQLRSTDTDVLWLDVDLVKVPPDLIEVLLSEGRGGICAPLVFVERVRRGPIGFANGGWFYDTGAFVKDGCHANMLPPIFPGYTGGTMELDSVGCCYLIPADVYRAGGTYRVTGDEVEHLALMDQARAMGYSIRMTRAIVEHAYLPKYGEKWEH